MSVLRTGPLGLLRVTSVIVPPLEPASSHFQPHGRASLQLHVGAGLLLDHDALIAPEAVTVCVDPALTDEAAGQFLKDLRDVTNDILAKGGTSGQIRYG